MMVSVGMLVVVMLTSIATMMHVKRNIMIGVI